MTSSFVRVLEDKRAGRPTPDIENPTKQTRPAPPFSVTVLPTDDPEMVGLKTEVPVGRGLWLFQMELLLTKTIKRLEEHDWTIVKAPSTIKWLSSDDPVILLDYHRPDHYDFGGGWGRKGCEVLFPLSPIHLFYTRIGHRRFDRGTILERPIAVTIRRMIAEHAFRMIFAAAPDDDVPSLRPRLVDDQQFRNEQRQWSDWHEDQSKAEADATGLIVLPTLQRAAVYPYPLFNNIQSTKD